MLCEEEKDEGAEGETVGYEDEVDILSVAEPDAWRNRADVMASLA
jgi:hypothetical protein